MSRRTKIGVAALAAVLLVVAGLMWLVVGRYYDTWNVLVRAITRKFVVRDLFPGVSPAHWTGLAWMTITLLLAGAAFAAVYHRRKVMVDIGYHRKQLEPRIEWGWDFAGRRRLVGAGLAIVTLLSGIYTIASWADNGKDEYAALSGGTTFVVEDINSIPSSLKPLTEGAKKDENGNLILPLRTAHDVPARLRQGTLAFDWKNRTSALSGAQVVMDRISGTVSGTEIMRETLTYLNGNDSWTAIRNGRGRQPVNSVVYWDGTRTTACGFAGKHSLNLAFGGKWGRNLDDTLARDYPDLFYVHDDMWGACSGSDPDTSRREPIIVIPTTRQYAYGHRTVPEAGDLLIIHGSPSGKPRIERRSSVKPGEFPGPVYAQSLVAKQRDLSAWAAGRLNKDADGVSFGYEPIDADSQGTNTSEFLLQDAKTGRLYWVTPLKPRGTASKVAIAMSITPADTLKAGGLNEQLIFVLSDGDYRVVNLDDMQARINDRIRSINSGFFSGRNPGEIVELLPVSTDAAKQVVVWQGYAQLNGRVKYRIVFPSDTTKVEPIVTDLEPEKEQKKAVCAKAPAQMSDQELTGCLDGLSAELRKRLSAK